MAGLPKRFAKMGFKKGWKLFKSQSRTTKTTKVQPMARFKRKAARRFGGFKRSRRSSGSSENLLETVGYGFAYGALRPKLKELASPMTQMLPLGENSDEIAFGLIGYFMAKKGTGMVKNAGRAILTVEAASLGNNIVAPMVGSALPTQQIQSQYNY